jgi:hypothetical protein
MLYWVKIFGDVGIGEYILPMRRALILENQRTDCYRLNCVPQNGMLKFLWYVKYL